MAAMNFLMFFLFLSILSILISFTIAVDPKYLAQECSNTTTFTRNSTYESNLNFFLSSLVPNASRSNGFSNGFFNATAGQDPNRVYGLFLCRGDVTSRTCQDCVKFATSDVTKRCPVEKVTVIWYDECLLRYSDQSFFSRADPNPADILFDDKSVTDPERFDNLVWSLMTEAAIKAASSPKRFATTKGNFTASQTLYCLVQCTPDLSSSDCDRCLRESFSSLRTTRVGSRVLFPSCNSRFETFRFYNESALPPPPSVPLTRPKGKKKVSNSIIIAIVAPIAAVAVIFIVACCFLSRRARKQYNAILEDNAGTDITTLESLQFDLGTIEVATNKFSTENKLGEGGFGEVYKGSLPSGQEIAVKRLSRRSVQGAEQFKTEVLLVSKLQHRNLVRLLGFCLEGEEKILVYEFVPNKSLDYFLYDPQRQRQLDWSKRYKIIGGIARGILYLHEDSRFRVIHRDLKVSNILLDGDMNSKISDFGMARIVGVEQTQENTNKIVGTYGYMPPEYAMRGHFSVKSDVYSFGILVLEIITGKKNNNFYQTDGAEDLLSYVWKHWRDNTPLQLLDPTLTDRYSRNEVIRCIHMALLCVQEDPAQRPTMATVVLMLNSYSVTLPAPRKPAFYFGNTREVRMPTKEIDFDQSTSKSMPWSVDEASITEVYPR